MDTIRDILPESLKRPLRRAVWAVRRRDSPPQLLMWYRGGVPPPLPPLPRPCGWKPFEPGLVPSWIEMLNANGELGRWNEGRIRGEVASLAPGGQQLVVDRGRVVAAAGVYDRAAAGAPAWEIGWVACHPQYRGRGLGRQVVAAALVAALKLPARPIFLYTDDHRLPGISIYLRLGFEPDLGAEPSFAARWLRIRAALA